MVTTIEGAMLSRRSRIDRKSHQQSTGSQLLLIYFWVRDKHTENIIYIKALFHRTCSCQIQTSRTGSNLLKVHFLGDEAACVGGTQDVQLWSKISISHPQGSHRFPVDLKVCEIWSSRFKDHLITSRSIHETTYNKIPWETRGVPRGSVTHLG